MSSILVGTDAKIHVGWFGVDDSTSGIPGTTPDGIGTFQLSLENGYTVTLRWPTDVIKTRSGQEQRISRNDEGKESYSGPAYLLGDQAVSVRATLAQSAANGAPILLGLQHEEAQVTAVDLTDPSLPILTIGADAMSMCDFRNPGQRVFVVLEDTDGVLQSAEAVIQSYDSTAFVVAPIDETAFTVVAVDGSRIMPAMPVLLEPQQDFARYPRDAEIWKLQGRAARLHFAMVLNTLDLGTVTVSSGLAAAIVSAKVEGGVPAFSMVADGTGAATLEESGSLTVIHYEPGVSTITQVYDLVAASLQITPTGTWGAGTLAAGDAFPLTDLSGGDTHGPVGNGATVTTYASHPVWDYEINIEETVTDSIQAMTEIIDHDGVPYAIGSADFADWGRAVVLTSKQRADWQWFKLFLSTIKGAQKAFWLPTWRDDLPFVSKATGTITVEGDVSAWWPAQRQHVQILETSGTVTRAEVTVAVDNGDGTWTLTIGTTLASSSVDMVSWLELCRFEKEEFQVTFDQHGFSAAMVARVVQR